MKKLAGILKIDFDQNRIFGLDLLRAFAIVSVVLVHGSSLLSKRIEQYTQQALPDGVSVFFVLSGFLIGGILINVLEKKKPSFKNLLHFWKRRWMRTLPLYYFLLLLLILLSILFKENFNIRQTLPYFVFLQNFYKSDIPFFLVSWSLSVEEWFYLIIPVMLFISVGVCAIKPKLAVLFTAALVIVATIGFRYHRYVTIDVSGAEVFGTLFRNAVITRLDSLMFGLIGAWLLYYYQTLWLKKANLLFLAGIVLHIVTKILSIYFLSKSVFFYCNLLFVLEAVSTLALLPYLSQMKPANGFIYKTITYISLISYSIYLLHAQIVLDWLLAFHFVPYIQPHMLSIIKYLLYWAFTILLSILSYKYIEMPFMKLRKGE